MLVQQQNIHDSNFWIFLGFMPISKSWHFIVKTSRPRLGARFHYLYTSYPTIALRQSSWEVGTAKRCVPSLPLYPLSGPRSEMVKERYYTFVGRSCNFPLILMKSVVYAPSRGCQRQRRVRRVTNIAWPVFRSGPLCQPGRMPEQARVASEPSGRCVLPRAV
ncbi:BgTH12-07136 [Blumeria graminis f. sp. triticale]|uniref:BgTH12-07136 n=1 Tax=Blumeria graminis f. sp. triticale TaxID=1689686 RepID=A0A9W4D8Z5_BLUGR|nr:BgTH12-07136 [Blumeria graminis f. sp. triticale]